MAFDQDDFVNVFQYGPNEGNQAFLKHLSEFLSLQYDDAVAEDRLVQTCGATHGLHLAASTLLSSTNGVVFVEDPTYFIALDVFQDLKLKVVSFELGNIEDLGSKIGKVKESCCCLVVQNK